MNPSADDSVNIFFILAAIIFAVITYFKIGRDYCRNRFKTLRDILLHPKCIYFLAEAPLYVVLAPIIEEMFFRWPLIFMFPVASTKSLLYVLGFAAIFGSLHYFNEGVFLRDVLQKINSKQVGIGFSIQEAVASVYAKDPRLVKKRKRINAVCAFAFGVLSGCAAVIFHSIILCIVLHALWNFVFSLTTFKPMFPMLR